MATITTDGLAKFAVSLEELQELQIKVIDKMLDAQADIIEPAQKAKGRAYGVYRTGVTLASIKRGSKKKTKNGRSIHITLQGRNADGNRNAEVAFINEFGKKNQLARPFIRDANEANADNAVAASAAIYDQYLKSKGL